VSALTIGVTASRFDDCKRGLAANYAAHYAAHHGASRRNPAPQSVCLIDADPRSCDVGTRLGVAGTSLQRFATAPAAAEIPRLAYPPLAVLPSAPGFFDMQYRQAYEAALATLRDAFDVVFVDLPAGTGRPGPTLDAGIANRLDVLLIASTPQRAALAATARHLELLAEARERGSFDAEVIVGVVITGDEGSAVLDLNEAVDILGAPVVGEVMQFWGRAQPNFGFGPTLGIAALEAQFHHLHRSVCQRSRRIATPVDPAPATAVAPFSAASRRSSRATGHEYRASPCVGTDPHGRMTLL
jgi:cellulose biosynthesis protein BcsQ